MKKSKMSGHFALKAHLRDAGYDHKTDRYNQTGSPESMSNGGMAACKAHGIKGCGMCNGGMAHYADGGFFNPADNRDERDKQAGIAKPGSTEENKELAKMAADKPMTLRNPLKFTTRTEYQATKRAALGMAEGGMVGQAAADIKNRQANLDAAEQRMVKGVAPEASSQVPKAPPSATAKAAAVQKTDPEAKPSALRALGHMMGFKDGGAVLPQSLRCYEEGGYVTNDEEEGLDRAVLRPGEGFEATPTHLPKLGTGFADGGVADYSTGGKVRGPGGPRDDKIPAMLSNGEYVLPADTVAHVGKANLDALKNATHKPSLRMADGGDAGNAWATDPSAASYGVDPTTAFALNSQDNPIAGPLGTFHMSQLDHGTGATPSNSIGTETMGPKGPGSVLTMGGAAKSISMANGGWVGVGGARLRYAEGDYVEDPRRMTGTIGQPATHAMMPAPVDNWAGAKRLVASGSALGTLGFGGRHPDIRQPMTPNQVTTPTIGQMSGPPQRLRIGVEGAPGVEKLGPGNYAGQGPAPQGGMTTEQANDYYGQIHQNMMDREGAAQDIRQQDYANLAANYQSPEDALRQRHNTTSLRSIATDQMSPGDKELATQRRGQDIALQGNIYGHQVQLRGQDLAAQTARGEQGVQLRGQTLQNNAAMMNLQRQLAQEQFTRELETQRFGLDRARTMADQRRADQDRFSTALEKYTGVNAKDAGQDVLDRHNSINLKLAGFMQAHNLQPGDIPQNKLPEFFQLAKEGALQDEGQVGKIAWLQRLVGTKESHTTSPNFEDYMPNGKPIPGAFGDDVPTKTGLTDLTRYRRHDVSGTATFPWNQGPADINRVKQTDTSTLRKYPNEE